MKRLDEIVNTGRLVPLVVLFLSLCMTDNLSPAAPSDGMRVTLLGTGTPFPNAERFGSAILVLLMSAFVRYLPIPFQPKESKSMRKRSRKARSMMMV